MFSSTGNKTLMMLLFFLSGLIAGFLATVMVTGNFGASSFMSSQTYDDIWRIRHILRYTGDNDSVLSPQANILNITETSYRKTTIKPSLHNQKLTIGPSTHHIHKDKVPLSHSDVDTVNSDHGPVDVKKFDDGHKHQDDTTAADQLYKDVKIFCYILTTRSNHKTKAVHVKATWAKRCNLAVFMSDVEDVDLPAIKLNTTIGRDHLTAKTMQAFDYAFKHYINEYDWFLKADDDTYVILENLRYLLSSHSPDEPIYFGHHFKTIVKQGYFSGGGGYAVSRESLRRFGHRKTHECATDHGAEDVEFGRCMEKVGVKTGDSRDTLGRSRFHCFNPETHLHGGYPDWYYQYDKYGAKKGQESISDYPVTFHYISVNQMYDLEFYTYHLRPYGIVSGNMHLNAPVKTKTTTVKPKS